MTRMPSISILGTGNVGHAIGKRLVESGYSVTFGTREFPSEAVKLLALSHSKNLAITSYCDAISASTNVVFAIPWAATQFAVAEGKEWSGKVVIDCMNPLSADFSSLCETAKSSAAEDLAALLPESRIIKAFNSIGVASILNSDYLGRAPSLLFCSDHDEAKNVVKEMAPHFGMKPIDVGHLRNACYLESLAMLQIHLAVNQGMGDHIALELLTR
jgi:8-hydroxy-5-deazaflavin:NADPH oxidoreductase